MKKYVFPYSIEFGKMDIAQAEIEIELTEAKAKCLLGSAKEGGRHRLDEDDNVQDIYDQVYYAIREIEKDGLKQEPSPVREHFHINLSEEVEEWHYDSYLDSLPIAVYYPRELQFLKRTRRKKAAQSLQGRFQ